MTKRQKILGSLVYLAGAMSGGLGCLAFLVYANLTNDDHLKSNTRRALLYNLPIGVFVVVMIPINFIACVLVLDGILSTWLIPNMTLVLLFGVIVVNIIINLRRGLRVFRG
ncbi:MAG: hypothetical protein HQ546_09485 [Planctomycetes bacterium]|nr:hypothetical protein [Planctomycetota bacterium]